MFTKSQMRKKINAETQAMTGKMKKEQSLRIFDIRKKSDNIIDNEVFFVYVSMENEVNTRDIIHELLAHKKRVLVPKIIDTTTMHAVEISSLSELAMSSYNILEPLSSKNFSDAIDVALVPGMAFGKDGVRLGKGRGYYDRFFAKYEVKQKIGLCFIHQVQETLVSEPHDVKMNAVLRPGGILNIVQ